MSRISKIESIKKNEIPPFLHHNEKHLVYEYLLTLHSKNERISSLSHVNKQCSLTTRQIITQQTEVTAAEKQLKTQQLKKKVIYPTYYKRGEEK